ncbi:uncharacterized protein LOC144714256 [Wolffia australiana]
MNSPHTPWSSEMAEQGGAAAQKGVVGSSEVDPFLVEALENPRHRLTVLRMELDIQRFLQNPDQYQFEFQHFPSSYLRRAAHRVAQHYGLQTVVIDNAGDGRARIVAMKMADNHNPSPISLAEISTKSTESLKPGDSVKIVIRARPTGSSMSGLSEPQRQDSMNKTVEEREEEYGKARARIFNENCGLEVREAMAAVAMAAITTTAVAGECEANRRTTDVGERSIVVKEASSGRVPAIFRDREKDRIDPDYDRSYGRYVRGAVTSQGFNLGLYHGLQPGQITQYEQVFPLLRQVQGGNVVAGGGFQQSGHVFNPHFYTAGCGQPGGDGAYVSPCPSPTTVYAQSYEHLRNAVLQGPFCQQPLSFEQHNYR